MSEIGQTIPPIHAKDVEELARIVEVELRRIQQQIWQLRQFIEPMVIHNKNSPNQQFNPLE